MKKSLVIIIILIIVTAAYYFYIHNKAYAPSYMPSAQSLPATSSAQNLTPTAQTQPINNTSTPIYTPPQSATGGENTGSNIQVWAVTFDGTKFSPDPVNINAGDYVFFENKSTVDFWPEAAQGGYPGFDSLKNLAPGGEYKFQFTKAGSWAYYDYSHPGVMGTVNVSH